MNTVIPAGITSGKSSEQRAVALWLLACCALVFTIVVIGGITRLTGSGLSIVEWQPIAGALPPLDHAQWEETFAKYRETPQFQTVNQGMSLVEFKRIFWWEYLHRLLGRLIGLAFFVPLVWFGWRGRIDRALGQKLVGIFILGGLQGALGWYMVQSGLVDDSRVSQYRLAAHLGLAVLIYGAMLWVALDLLHPVPARQNSLVGRGLRLSAWTLTGLIYLMIITGAFVAGIRAGRAYNTFPLMNGHWVPPEIFMIDPWYRNFFENMATAQFDHRIIAWILALAVPWFWIRIRGAPVSPRARLGSNLLLALLVLQIALGIATLLLAVPIPLAAAHQAGALLVFTSALFVTHSVQ